MLKWVRKRDISRCLDKVSAQNISEGYPVTGIATYITASQQHLKKCSPTDMMPK